MDFIQLAIALVSIILTGLIAAIFWRKSVSGLEKERSELIFNLRETEKRHHLAGLDFLEKRNEIEVAHSDAVKKARSIAYEEGRLFGRSESNANHVNNLAEQRQELLDKCEREKTQAVDEARNQAQVEYEYQSKLFSVKISPYVSVEDDKKLFRHLFRTKTGYQYQLLVNGIPAFSPHIVIEQIETKGAINPEVERLLLKAAEKAANSAIKMYLGGNAQFATLAEPILNRLPG